MARACEDLFGRSEAIRQFLADFAEKNKEAATGFTAAVKKVLAKIKEFFENLMFGHGSRTLEAGIVRKCGTDVVDGLMAQYEKTFFAALEGNAARNALGEFEQGGIRYSQMNDDSLESNVDRVLQMSDDEALQNKAAGNYISVMTSTPAVVIENVPDAENLKIIMRFDAFYLATRQTGILEGHYHNYGDIMKKLPDILSDPLAIVRMDNGRLNFFATVPHPKGSNNVISLELNTVKDIDSQYSKYNLIITVTPAKDNYVRNTLTKHGIKVEYKKEDLPQVNNQLYEWLAIINDKSSNNSIPQNAEMSTPDAKKLLENRVSGDDLLNAQDLIADVQELGGQVDEYGYITLYHRTSADKAAAIRSTGEMVAKENGLFFSTKQEGQNVGYGDTVVTFSIPAEKLLLDDIFDDEAHLRFPLDKPGRVSVQEYLVSEDTGNTGVHSDPEDDIDNRTFSYNELVAKGDLQGVVIGKARQVPLKADGSIDDDAIVKDVKSKCQTVTTKGGTTYFVSVPDIGRNVEIVNGGITHGFMKPNDQKKGVPRPHALINARVALNLSQILKNSIEVNRSQRGTNIDVPYTHVMMGTAALEDAQGKLEYYAVRSMIQERKNQNPILVEANVLGKLHAANAQKISTPTVRGAQNGVALADGDAYAYSIADFLQDVKGVFDDTFSLDVYNRLGVQRKASEFSQYLLHSDPEDDVKSDREILAGALMSVAQNEIERNALKVYQGYVKQLDDRTARLREVNAEIRSMMFQKGARDEAYTKKLEGLKAEKATLERAIDRWDRKLFALEVTKSLQDLLDREKQRTAKLWIDAGRKAMNNYREKQLCRVYTQKIEDKAKNLRKMLLENSEKYHIPDAFKKPVAAFLSLLDFSSERALQGGELTKKDMELQAAFAEVVTLLESLTDENSSEYVNGLDLPPDAVEEFVSLSKEVAQMAIDGREGDTMVLRRMSSEQLKTLNTTLYAMTRAVRQANDLFANERFRHVSEIALDFIGNSEQYAAREQRSKISDFLSWENMVPYYAFRRLGAAGEALFKGFMQGQDTFAFLVKEIIDFTDKLYTEEEVKEWSRQVHTFDGTNGKVYITTAQIMSLYELWKDKDARQHILGGGVLVQDLDFGIKKKYTNDPDGTALGELVVDAMFAKLTPRQKAVADSLQKFMAEECAKWGNEVSYKRWGIRIFGLDYYFPIESDKNTVAADVEQRAKESGLFSLLHKSFTKKRVLNANNRIMIRSVFDVFASHTTDMAKYHAFALPLLDMQKFINFKENVTKEQAAAEAYGSAEVNEDIKVLVKKVKGNQYKSNDCVSLGTLDATNAAKIQEITGRDFSGYEVLLEARQVKHILNRHGENGKANASMADDSDIAKMQFAMLNADEIRDAGLSNAYVYFDGRKNRLSPTVVYEKAIGKNSYYVIQTVADTARKKLYVVTAFIGESQIKKGAPQSTDAQGSDETAKPAIVGTPTNSIAQSSGIVKMGISTDDEQKDTSFTTKEVRTSMEKAFGTAAYKYIEQFLIDLNGHRSDQMAFLLNLGYSKAKSGAYHIKKECGGGFVSMIQ